VRLEEIEELANSQATFADPSLKLALCLFRAVLGTAS